MASATHKRLARYSTERKKIQEKKLASIDNKEWVTVRSALGVDYLMFYVFLGARERGKSYDVMRYCLRQSKKFNKPFYWLRLTEPSVNNLLKNNAADLIDADLRRSFKLDLKVKGKHVYDGDNLMCTVLALSTYYNDKGVAHFDCEFDLGYNIVLDEMNREVCEKNTFDITYAFVNQMENLIRSQKSNVKIMLVGNNTVDASDILCCFNFIPEQFGRYILVKNKKKLLSMLAELKAATTPEEKQAINLKYQNVDFGKRCLIDYIPNNQAYKARRHGTVSDILTPTDSNVTNKKDVDVSLITKKRVVRPTNIIKFTNKKETWFTLWDGEIIASWKNQNVRDGGIAMRKFIDHEIFNTKLRDTVIERYDSRSFKFRDLITQKKFIKELQLLKGSKY